jgi:hypothetical protein
VPDPLLTPEAWQAAAEVCVQHNQLPLELDALRAFLAAQDPEALIESYNEGGSPDLSELSDRDRRLLGDYNRWLRLGGDDA